MKALIVVAAALATAPAAAQQADPAGKTLQPRYEAHLSPLDGSTATGHFTFVRAGAFVAIRGSASGLGNGKHGIHVHEGKSCDARGGHYNPAGTPHGAPDQPPALRHVGDLGNLVAQEGGRAQYARIEQLARLDGRHSIVGRVLVLHAAEDDYRSQPSGGSGKEIACGVIVPAASSK